MQYYAKNMQSIVQLCAKSVYTQRLDMYKMQKKCKHAEAAELEICKYMQVFTLMYSITVTLSLIQWQKQSLIPNDLSSTGSQFTSKGSFYPSAVSWSNQLIFPIQNVKLRPAVTDCHSWLPVFQVYQTRNSWSNYNAINPLYDFGFREKWAFNELERNFR